MFNQHFNFSLSFFVWLICLDSDKVDSLQLVYMSSKLQFRVSLSLFFFVVITYLLQKSHCLYTIISQALGLLMMSIQCHLMYSSVVWIPVVINMSTGLTSHRFDALERIHYNNIWYHEHIRRHLMSGYTYFGEVKLDL